MRTRKSLCLGLGIGILTAAAIAAAQETSPPPSEAPPTAPLDLGAPEAPGTPPAPTAEIPPAPPSIPNPGPTPVYEGLPPVPEPVAPSAAASPSTGMPAPAPAASPAPVAPPAPEVAKKPAEVSPAPEAQPSPEPMPEIPAAQASPEPLPGLDTPVPAHADAGPPPPAAEPVSTRAADIRTPVYQRVRPAWAAQLTGSFRAMGGKSYYLAQTVKNIRGFSGAFEWQPRGLQGFGVFSLGPSLNWYPETPSATLGSSRTAMWSIGGQMRYQARFVREQPVVPILGLSAESFNYRFANGAKGHIVSVGGVGGVMVLLNVFEPSGAAAFYANYGVIRSYLVAEFRGYSGSDVNVTLGGSSLFFGVRVEY